MTAGLPHRLCLKRLPIPYTRTLIVLNALVGIIRLGESPNRTHSMGYKYAKALMPSQSLRWWGVMFLAIAVLLVVSYRSAFWLRLIACFGFGLWMFWALLLLAAAVRDGRSSFVGPVLYAAGAIRHFQVLRRR